MPLEEHLCLKWILERESDALITNFESNTTEESCAIEEEEAVPNVGHLEGVSTEPEHGQARPQFHAEFQFISASTRYRAVPPKDEMLPQSVALDALARTAQNVSRRSQCLRQKCW